MIYDIIGDIHGQADKLIGLLTKLGYRHDGYCYQPPANHQAIFIGDFIDRGSRQLDTLQIVFDMLDHGAALAVMGNHEYNAIGYATPHPDGDFCRPRTSRNTKQHQAFLDEAPLGSDLHAYWLSRLYELPLWLELPMLNVIHACWDTAAQQVLSPHLTANRCLTPAGIIATALCDSPEFFALERLLKGIESPLPAGVVLIDGHDIVRKRTRVKWWLDDWQNRPLSEAAQLGTRARMNLPDDCDIKPLPIDFRLDTAKPIFIGHYWLDGTPAILSGSVVCTDYSAGTTGHLTAYQFDTDNPTLDNGNFVQYIASA
ncbi:metallophosphoesterase [Moraxella sp. ZJ142]|uniref:metallophosphoesterase n=1 Tax=Moraxella marmotae TaxID=3344520 RepID=UPI0035D492D0